ncbi:MAG: PH domain-containing protein [Sedimentisphaerales bacterium]|nr:PH domain-containing protein [Sedimentisphaerales bacterium]
MQFHYASQVIGSQVRAGERVLWTGQPAAGLRLRASDVFMIPFSVMWGGFAIVWEYIALTAILKSGGGEGAPPSAVRWLFPLWGVPFVLIGLYMMFGRFWVDAKMRAKTFYGVTNERVIIQSGLFKTKVRFLNLRTLGEIAVTKKNDGSGTITFGVSGRMGNWGGFSSGGQGQQVGPQFEMIPNVDEVYRIVDEAQKASMGWGYAAEGYGGEDEVQAGR